MDILGISAYEHDSAACLVRDGKIISAARQEWFDRKKSSASFPLEAVNFCLQYGNITADDLDYAGFYEQPFLKFNRVIADHLDCWPFSFKGFLRQIPDWLQDRLIVPLALKRDLGFDRQTLFIKHHLSHAAGAFLQSPFEEAAIITADGAGEWATLCCGVGRGSRISVLREMRYPDSLGCLYSAVASYLGFPAGSESQVMDLAIRGTPDYHEAFGSVCEVKADASFHIKPGFLVFGRDSAVCRPKFIKLFGNPRKPGEELQSRHYSIAASLQQFIEEILVLAALNLCRETGREKLCLGGGMFANSRAVARIAEDSGFREVFVQPACGNSGAALGAALYIYHSLLGNARCAGMQDTALGPDFPESRIRRAILNSGLEFTPVKDDEGFFGIVGDELVKNREAAWFQGRMEFGSGFSSKRCILANPAAAGIEAQVKSKEDDPGFFKQHAILVREEAAAGFFRIPGIIPSDVIYAQVKENKPGFIPVLSRDRFVRVKIVKKGTDARLWGLLNVFEQKCGIPMLLSSCFDSPEEPVVCSPEDALSGFKKKALGLLALGDYIVRG